MARNVILGIDGGGTYIRVAVTDYEGNLLVHEKYKGSAFARRTDAKENMYYAIKAALNKANCALEDVAAIGAGIAGYDSEDDLNLVQNLTAIEGLECLQVHANDAAAAHVGAFLGEEGILAISGSGSIVYGITKQKCHIRNYDFNHRTKTGAQHITYNFVHHVLAGDADASDRELVEMLLHHFEVKDIVELAWLGARGFGKDKAKRIQLLGNFAPKITAAALTGSALAGYVCEQAAQELITGIKILGPCFESKNINVALGGSVANSRYIKERIKAYFEDREGQRFVFCEPVLLPELGAVVMAMQKKDICVSEEIIENLKKSSLEIKRLY